MTEFHRFYANKDSMILWDTFISARYVEPKTTETGYHPSCVMFSCGRRIKDEINDKKISELPESTRTQLLNKYNLEKYVGNGKSLKERIINKIWSTYKRFGKILGFKAKKVYENSFEIYQFCKFRKIEEFEPIIATIGLCFGVLAKINKISESDIIILRQRLRENLTKSFIRGYKLAKRENWV